MPISFNAIPVDIRVPGQYVEIDNSNALQSPPGIPSRILVLGQRRSTGSVPEAVPVRVLNEREAEAYFGRGSILHLMFRRLKKNNNWTESWAIALDDNVAGVAATGIFSFTGPATAAGTINAYIGGVLVQCAVASGDAATAIATAFAAAVNAKTDLPVTAAVDGVDAFKVNITFRHKGLVGNGHDLRLNYYQGEALPAGVGCVITAMANGTANPDIATAIAAFGEVWYTDIATAWTDSANLTNLETELAERWGPLTQQDGAAYAGALDTHSNLVTLGNGRNSKFISTIGANGSPSPTYEWAAALCGVAAYYTKIDPARPLQTLPLVGLLPPTPDKLFTQTERNLLLNDGIATWKRGEDGTIMIERCITMYQVNSSSIADPSYLDIETMKTLALLRFEVRAVIAQKFPRHKLADDGTQFDEGQAIVTPSVIRAEMLSLFIDWERRGLVEGREQFKRDLIVERDLADRNRVNVLIPPDVVNQFRVFAGKVEFRL